MTTPASQLCIRFEISGNIRTVRNVLISMKRKSVLYLCAGAVMTAAVAIVAQVAPTEAPSGFTTPSLTQSPAPATVSNGLAEPPGDTFVADQMEFERVHDPTNGLGPLCRNRCPAGVWIYASSSSFDCSRSRIFVCTSVWTRDWRDHRRCDRA